MSIDSSAPPGKASHRKKGPISMLRRTLQFIPLSFDSPRQTQARVVYDSKPPLADILPRRKKAYRTRAKTPRQELSPEARARRRLANNEPR